MAAILPISDRRARLSLILALLGLPSMGVTLPAAVSLGSGALRQQRLASGAEPAMGFLALVVAGIDVLFIQHAAVRMAAALGPSRTWVAASWAIGLAGAIVLLAFSSLRIHPERRGVGLVVRGALAASIAGGTALLLQGLALVGS
ncbi:MAG TPA: hypothetical protein VF108_01065 [Actinomycetota bacterium]